MSAAPAPNILILYSDQHRADAVGFANPRVKTPNLDRLASAGTVFDRSFCQYPVCTPSRMSLLTGQYVHTHGCSANNTGAHPNAPLFPRLLRERGYQTAAMGKMHFHPTYAAYGFDHLELAEQNGPGRFQDDYHRWLTDRGCVDLVDLIDQEREFRQHAGPEYWETFGAQASDLPEELHSTTWIGDRAVAWLERAEPPFCAWVGFVKPHHPFDPPASWLATVDENALEPLPGWTETIPEADADAPAYFGNAALALPPLRRVMAHYFATISHLDAQIGRVLEVLQRRGLGDTIVIYTSDHGELLGFHHMLLKGSTLYDPLVRVPLIVSGPPERGWRRGVRTDALVESLDVTSTILDAAGINPPGTMQGRSLAPVLRGETESHRDEVFCQTRGMGLMMLRTPRWKLIQGARGQDRMLFDLRHDPTELHNVYEDPSHAEVRCDLEQRLFAHLCHHHRREPHTRALRQPLDSTAQRAAVHQRHMAGDPQFRGITPYAALAQQALDELQQG